ncbi:armadillo repeat-containing protein 8-like [Chenopodium quinoa]|uniref:armadillo repeat-containing protein 8-like n=1 Tax=Chenopodium quinoa TaxID=63459 RepID=UPI000B76F54B|nr:armadillo repeat-containing protein 8-like [Chenopodium quinoa]
MPTSATNNRPEDLILRLSSPENQTKFKALRELKNQIIGNRTKKLTYVKSGVVVPAVVNSLSSSDSSVIVQASAVIGSFACGVDAGVKAVLDAGAFSLLLGLVSHSDVKVVDAAARSLKIIYQSKLAPKYDFLSKENMCFLISLLDSESENITGLGATIITHSCQIIAEQKVLYEAGILKKLLDLLRGSLSQRDASLEALAAVSRNNPDVSSEFAEANDGRAFRVVCELTKDKYPRTRLLASMCLIALWNTSPCHLQDAGLRSKLIHILIELLDDPGQVGDDAPFALSSLIAGKEDLQKLAFEADVIDKMSKHLMKDSLPAKRLQGIFLALADVCSKLEVCRENLISLEVLKLVAEALNHDCSEVRIAACMCLRSVSRSVKNLSAGMFMNDLIVIPLIKLLNDASTAVQIAALSALCNVVVEFTTRKSIFLQYGVVKQLVHLSTSMDSTVRLNAVRALKNLIFLAEKQFKGEIFLELSPATLWSLICDHESSVQEQAISFVRNLVDGCVDSIEYIFTEEAIILHAIVRLLRNTSNPEVCIQGMYVLANVATGNEFHKEAVLQQLLPPAGSDDPSVLIKLLQSNDNRLRTATVWTVVNLTFPSSPGAYSRLVKLRNAGVYSSIKNMANDSCLDVKLRVKTALDQ